MRLLAYVPGFVARVMLYFLAFIGALHLTRRGRVRRVRGPGESDGTPSPHDERFADTVGLITKTPLLPGHRIEVLTCGDEFYPRLFDDLARAERSITMQMYYANPGAMADRFAEVLVERVRAGVSVLFLRDAFGTNGLPPEYWERLKEGGVTVAEFRPTRWYELHKAYYRSHIRIVVVDGRVGYTGGFGIDDKWYGDGRHEDQWRDTGVRFEGPAVQQHQAAFAAGWAEATGILLTGDRFFRPDGLDREPGEALAGLLHASPTMGSTPAERFYAFAIASARSTCWITNAYFVPNSDFVRLLVAAAERGVDVRVLTPGDRCDVESTMWAGRATFDALITGGVRIWEYQPVMHHAKTIVVDDRFVGIGTMNFDNRSFTFNDETVLMVLDDEVGATLRDAFLADLNWAREVTPENRAERGLRNRVLEAGFSKASRVL